MESNQICQVKGCDWPVVLCPELCAPHWWKLDRDVRNQISRAQIKGQKAGIHPSPVYQGLIGIAIRGLNITQGILPVYDREPDDLSTKTTSLSFCHMCCTVEPHHGVVRGGESYMVCSKCQSMVPTVLPGSERLPGMEAAP